MTDLPARSNDRSRLQDNILSPETVLVVQGETDVESKGRALTEAGFHVLTATSAAEAVRIIAEHQPEVAVLTRTLTDSETLEVCRAMKQNVGANGKVLLLASSREDTSADREVNAAEGVARTCSTQAAVCTQQPQQSPENHEQWMQAVRRSYERLRIVSRNLLTAQDHERRRIARELHDDYCQQMAMIEGGLRHLRHTYGAICEQQVEELIRQVSAVSQNLRTLSHSLHPAIVEDLGLEAGLAALCEEFEARHNLATQVITTGVDHEGIAAATATTFYRIAKEALRNIAKHAGGDVRVTLTLSKTDQEWCLTIHDDGYGFDCTSLRHKNGLGLVSMQERMSLIGGRLEIDSAPGAGTTVRAWAPTDTSSSNTDTSNAVL